MISHSIVTEVINTIVNRYKPEKIFVFGSFARKELTKDSDLDLLIIKDTDESFYMRSRAIRSLFGRQPCPMDILVFTPEEFEKRKNTLNNIVNIAVKTGELVYERSD
jgi:predicted nucleotidyltransferase